MYVYIYEFFVNNKREHIEKVEHDRIKPTKSNELDDGKSICGTDIPVCVQDVAAKEKTDKKRKNIKKR